MEWCWGEWLAPPGLWCVYLVSLRATWGMKRGATGRIRNTSLMVASRYGKLPLSLSWGKRSNPTLLSSSSWIRLWIYKRQKERWMLLITLKARQPPPRSCPAWLSWKKNHCSFTLTCGWWMRYMMAHFITVVVVSTPAPKMSPTVMRRWSSVRPTDAAFIPAVLLFSALHLALSRASSRSLCTWSL